MATKKTPGKNNPADQADLFSNPIEIDVVEVDEASAGTASGDGSGNHDPNPIDLNEDGTDRNQIKAQAKKFFHGFWK